jgi:TPR repeat protein
MSPTADEITLAKRGLDRALSAKNADEILMYRYFLADAQDTDSMREYAKMLEKKSDATPEIIDTAMGYYKRAAEKLDPYSAYRYSRLVERTSNVAARFWLRFSAVLGSIDAYPETADLFSLEGQEHIASYYLSLAAACDDTDSIVAMARRFYDGVGVDANEAFAKWYLDKLAIPPISAIKLAYRLRSVKAAEPPKPTFPEYDKYLRSLADEAKRCSFDTAYFGINEILYKRGNINAEVTLGILCAEGVGTERDFERAEGLAVELKTYRPVNGSKQFSGDLVGLRDGMIVIKTGPDTELSFAKKDVAIVRPVIDFDEADLQDETPAE